MVAEPGIQVAEDEPMAVVAYRAGKAITDESELKAYLASLLRLENVGLLLGAGASCSAGGRVMRQLWKDFLESSPAEADKLLAQKFISEPQRVGPRPPTPPVPLSAVPTPPSPPSETPNIEELVDNLEIAIHELRRQGHADLVGAQQLRAALFRAVLRAATLNDLWWKSQDGAELAEGLASHRAVLQKLTSARQPGQSAPWVFTTNYDLAIEWAAEAIDMHVINGFLGVHSRRFSPQSFDLGFRNTQARGEARFGVYNIYLAKLHGSLTWKEVDRNLYEVSAAQAWPEISNFIQGKTNDLNYLVLPRAAKYFQTVGYVLGELLRRFAEFMARPQTALIIAGYGFGDEHINRLLRSALLNPTLQVVIYLPEFAGNPADANLTPTVRRLLALQNPRVTIVGGGEEAFFSKLAEHLPDPTIYDEGFAELERKLKPREVDSASGAA